MNGRIHSIETMGAVDGPGLRYIVFTQGCLLRCQYCHNADTWKMGDGREVTPEEIVNDAKKYKSFFKTSGGGITISGGEPLLQLDFLIDVFKLCKKEGIHTTIDTSAGSANLNNPKWKEKMDELLNYTDLILLDLKHINNEKHTELVGMGNEHIKQFATYLSDKKVPVWIRHVLVPTKTDDEGDLKELAAFIHTLQNVERVEVLPYHQMGIFKWEELGLTYPLAGIEPPTEASIKKAKEILGAK
ncbi:MAG: pyruvate formate-lyase-activating protein [Bacillaceae bacterium]